MSTIFLETPRLILRQWKESDHEPYIELNGDSDVMEFFPSVMAPDDSRRQAQRIAEAIDKNGYGFFAAERKDNHQFIGFTGLSHPGFDVAEFTPGVEIGWRLSKANWGQGFATEAARACLAFGFDQLMLDVIYSFTSVHNQRSEQVMRKIGMEKSGFFDHPLIADGHTLKKHIWYKIDNAKSH